MAEDQNFDTSNSERARDIINEINDALRASVNELKTQRTISADITRDFSNYSKVVDKIKQSNEGLADLSEKELQKLFEKQKIILQQLKDKARDLDISKKLSIQEQALLNAAEEGFSLQEEALKATEEAIRLNRELNKSYGIGGTLLNSTEGFLNKIGLASASNLLNFDKARQSMRETASDLQDAGNNMNSFGTKTKILGAGLKQIGQGIRTNLLDPTLLFGLALNGFLATNNAAADYSKTTGLSANNIQEGLNSLETTADQYKALSKISKELAINAGLAFNPEQTQQVSYLTERLGLSGKQAGVIAFNAKLTNQDIEESTKNIFKQTGQFAVQNKLNINGRQILEDVANTSMATTVSLGNNVQKITQANLEARKLGLTLEQVEGIAGSLTDFQSSISNELEAELLTGKQLNLEQARYFALTNDIEGLSKEIGKNQDIINSFSSGNRIQQEAIAKSLGLSREEVAKMVYDQAISRGITSEQAALQAGMTMEQAGQLSLQEKISKIIEKLSSIFGNILSVVEFILDNSWAMYSALTLIGIVALPRIIKGASSFVGSLKEGVGYAGQLLSKLGDTKLGKFGQKLSSFGGTKAESAIPDTSKVTKGAGSGVESLGKSFSNVGKDLANIAKGSAAVGLMALSSLLLIPALPGLLLSIPAGAAASFGLPLLGEGFSALGSMLSQIIQGSIALAFLSGGIYLFGSALSTIKDIDPAQMITFGLTLTGLGLAAALLGTLMVPIILGSVAISILAGSLALFGLALSSAASDTKSIESLVTQISALTNPTLLSGLFMLGPALLSAAAGLSFFALALGASSLISGLSMLIGNPAIDTLMQLANIAPQLQTVGTSLSMIADSLLRMNQALTQLDVDKLEQISEIADNNSLEGFAGKISGAITKPLESMSGKNDKSNNELNEIKNILNQILQKEGAVKIDSTKIGTALGMKTYRIQ